MSPSETRDKVFAPGNLIHGTWRTVFEFPNFFLRGICPGKDVDHSFYTPEFICLSMLGEEELPNRYLNSAHFGPKRQDRYYSADDIKVGFIISREKILAAHRGQVYAVGYSFWNKLRYSMILKGQSVYDIPVRHPGNRKVFKDEVRLYPPTNPGIESGVISPEMYLGLVAFPSYIPSLVETLQGYKIPHALPVFSPQCEFISYIQ